ncbi:hypothetical protein Tco_0416986 [Tanacetum coccineum]
MNYQPVRSKNQANKTASPEEANHSAGTKDNIDAGNFEKEADPAQDYFVLPIYSSYTSTDKSSEAKNKGEKHTKDTGLKTNEEPVDQEDQAFLEDLERLKRQENEAYDVAEVLRKEFDINGNSNDAIFTNASYNDEGAVADFSNLESTMIKISEALEDESWVDAIKEELLQFKIQKVWILVDLPYRNKAIGTNGSTGISRMKEVLCFEIRQGLKPLGSFWPWFLYGIHSLSDGCEEYLLIWYNCMRSVCGLNSDRLMWMYYFWFLQQGPWCDVFKALTESRFQMSFIGELTFFLGLQVKQKEDGIFIGQDKSMIGSLIYLTASRTDIMYLKGKPKLGLWYPRVSSFDLRLISWQCKKQTIVATSTIKANYVAAANCCGQVLWIQNQMLDYGFNFMNTKIYIDNESTICIVKNPVFHSKTKHIEIRHHFIRDAYEKKLIQVLKIHTDDNVADLLTKAFDVSRHQELASPEQTDSALAIPGKTKTGKESSNLLMADSLPKTIQSNDPPLSRGYTLGSGEDSLKLMELMEFVQNCVTW